MRSLSYHLTEFSLGTLCIIIAGLAFIFRDLNKKEDFGLVKGTLTYYAKTYRQLPKRHHGKERYLMVKDYPEVFEVFIGEEKGDFSPEFQTLDQLKVGDEISIYYAEPFWFQDSSKDLPKINRQVRFIDKGNTAYYIKGDFDKVFGNALVIIGAILACFLYVFRQKI